MKWIRVSVLSAELWIMAFLLVFAGCGGKDDNPAHKSVRVSVNGILQSGAIPGKNTSGGLVVDARAFASKIPGLMFFSMRNPPSPGMVLQYGKTISFVSAGFSSGFCSLKEIFMDTPLEISEGLYWTPLNFLAGAVSGEIRMEAGGAIIAVTLPPPLKIGDIVPRAQAVARQLETEFFVRQGEISLADAVGMFVAGYTPDCNGNNATNPYLVVQNPTSPRAELFNRVPFGLQMDQDEAFVWVGDTPPECKYFSYQHYLMTRYFEGNPRKIYARLGDSINRYNIPLNRDPFNQFFVFIITGNGETHDHVTAAVLKAGIAEDRILSLVLPDDVRFGMEMESDVLSFLHRATMFDRDSDKEDYVNNPALEILRLTPRVKKLKIPMKRPVPRDRETGIREQDIAGLEALLGRLKANIIARYGGDFQYIRELKTSTWLYPGNDQAIEEGKNVLGETNDTLYLQTGQFVLNEDDLIIVYGVNHDRTGKTVYANVSCYGIPAFNGVGGVTSTPKTPDVPDRISYFGTAKEYLPDVSPALQEMLYVYKFARTPVDDHTFQIPYNEDGSYTGINDGVTVFMGFRLYVDVQTTIGPYPGDTTDGNYFSSAGPPGSEVFFDQAILFTNTPS